MNEVQRMILEMNSPYNDGFTTFAYKQKLLLIKNAIDKALELALTHVGEDEWIKENIK
jgi:hypothetical protein